MYIYTLYTLYTRSCRQGTVSFVIPRSCFPRRQIAELVGVPTKCTMCDIFIGWYIRSFSIQQWLLCLTALLCVCLIQVLTRIRKCEQDQPHSNCDLGRSCVYVRRSGRRYAPSGAYESSTWLICTFSLFGFLIISFVMFFLFYRFLLS